MPELTVNFPRPSDFDIIGQQTSPSEQEDNSNTPAIERDLAKKIYEEYQKLDTEIGEDFNQINAILKKNMALPKYLPQQLYSNFYEKYQEFKAFSQKIPSTSCHLKERYDKKVKILFEIEKNLTREFERGKLRILPNPTLPE